MIADGHWLLLAAGERKRQRLESGDDSDDESAESNEAEIRKVTPSGFDGSEASTTEVMSTASTPQQEGNASVTIDASANEAIGVVAQAQRDAAVRGAYLEKKLKENARLVGALASFEKMVRNINKERTYVIVAQRDSLVEPENPEGRPRSVIYAKYEAELVPGTVNAATPPGGLPIVSFQLRITRVRSAITGWSWSGLRGQRMKLPEVDSRIAVRSVYTDTRFKTLRSIDRSEDEFDGLGFVFVASRLSDRSSASEEVDGDTIVYVR